MTRMYLDQDEELILMLYRAPTLRETIRTIRQVLNMTTSDEDMTRLLHRTLEDLTMMDEEDFRSRRRKRHPFRGQEVRAGLQAAFLQHGAHGPVQ